MMKGKALPTKKVASSGVLTGLNRKDELYNAIIDLCNRMDTKFPRDNAVTDGGYFVQTVCNALWYKTNQMDTINITSKKQKDVQPVPDLFEQFDGYNDTKRKKQKSEPMTSSGLQSHAECLFSLLEKPYVNSTTGKWPELRASVEALASCLSSYEQYLNKQATTTATNKELSFPCRTVDQNASVFHCKKSVLSVVKDKYTLLDKAVVSSDTENPVLFDENLHVEKPFENSMQKFRFFDSLQLSVPVDVIRFCPGEGLSFVRGQVTAFVNDSVTRPVRITNQTCHEHQEDSAKKPGKPKGSLKQMEEEKLKWLPEPELDDTREHFLPYKQATNQETTEKDRPSLTDKKVCKKNTVKPRPGSSVEIHGEIEEDEERETSGQPQNLAAKTCVLIVETLGPRQMRS
ncbi:uncharacterized protein LOC127863537 [Dreissena polymorpha]|uniref:uncharacterized protein LOC127863537 n=1 Tax=Dreissena polymorpha TaxID=45954 RepID=UPI0022645E95|nr:uncharacterized protein LOC127863537 [Dreissena polymorpha]